MLLEYAHAHLGRARTSPAVLHAWAQKLSHSPGRRYLSYWVALTRLRRGEAGLAYSAARAALQAPQTADNPELHWRLAALAFLAGKAISSAQDGAAMRAQAENGRQRISESWGEDAPAYFGRHDLTLLHRLPAVAR
ncbi:MAG: hypothetical protein WD690_08700 [Vicinamibacterales bacterium]